MKQLLKLFIIGVVVVFGGKIIIDLLPTILTMVTSAVELLLKGTVYVLIGYVALRLWHEVKRRNNHGKIH